MIMIREFWNALQSMAIRGIAAPCVLLAALLAAGCGSGSPPAGEASASHEPVAGEYERGPHRGRMLRDGDFALELQIFEDGVPPEFHVHLYRDGKALTPDSAEVSVSLLRLDGQVDRFAFKPEGAFLKGDGTVTEPHSFQVSVEAREGGKSHTWQYDSFEGRTTIASDTAEAAGIVTEVAGGATIVDSLALTGRLVPNAERTRAVSARFPGVIREVSRSVGDRVREGDRLATVESDESLQTYAVRAPISGVIMDRHANAGEKTGESPMFVIVDHGSLWAELTLFPRDLARVRPGQKVLLKAADADLSGEGEIVRVAPAEEAQHGGVAGLYVVRVALGNRAGLWNPGLFVEGRVRVGAAAVDLAVKRSALQGFRDFTVVFEQVGDTYEVRMLELGRQDETWVEVLGGLKPGVRYVTGNSFLIKADIEKSGASHDH
jgi:cobalt-zinc-cadmium efflux system membrane fusion protein